MINRTRGWEATRVGCRRATVLNNRPRFAEGGKLQDEVEIGIYGGFLTIDGRRAFLKRSWDAALALRVPGSPKVKCPLGIGNGKEILFIFRCIWSTVYYYINN